MSKAGAAETILLLDDDQHFRQLVTKLLTMAGYSVVEAQSAMVATALITEKRPALAIVDYRLPGMNGITWIENMRASGISIPMVISTATTLDGESVEDLSERLNIPFIIPKPVDPAVFLNQIQTLLSPATNDKGANGSGQAVGTQGVAAQGDSTRDGSFMDEFEQELVAATVEYLTELKKELAGLAGGAINVDVSDDKVAQTLKSFAHKVRGTSGSYGLGEISKNAGLIEDLLLPGNSDASDEVEYLSCAVSELLQELRRNVEQAIGDRGGNSQAQARV